MLTAIAPLALAMSSAFLPRSVAIQPRLSKTGRFRIDTPGATPTTPQLLIDAPMIPETWVPCRSGVVKTPL